MILRRGYLVMLVLFLLLIFGCTTETGQQTIENKIEEEQSRTIGFIGCSNTAQSIYGYRWAGGQKMWFIHRDNINDFDSGTVYQWINNDDPRRDFWEIFERYYKKHPNTDTIWWQLCIPQDQVGVTAEEAEKVIQKLRNRIPNVKVYVSPLSEFPDHVCEITGVEGVERSKVLARELDERNDDVFMGPIVGPLTLKEIWPQEDLCHPNEEGMGKIGMQLKEFFDDVKRNKTQDNLTVEEFDDVELNNTQNNLTVEDEHWKRVFDKALEPVECSEPRDPKTLPDGYYKGPMIDTHVHIPNLPGGEPGLPLEYYSGNNLGTKKSIEEWTCMLQVEGSTTWGFFSVDKSIDQQSVDIVKMIVEKHPGLFVPFMSPPGQDGKPTIPANDLEEMLQIEPGLFKGYGEIGLWDYSGTNHLPPDSQRLLEIYPVLRKNNLVVYFHPGVGQEDELAKVAAANRDISFVFHGGNFYNVSPTQVGVSQDEKILIRIEEILYNNPNVYYGVDELYGQDWLLEPGRSKDAFLANFIDYDVLLKKDLSLWKGFIERHPDQVLWGTDRGVSAEWDKDPDIALTLNNYTRLFIGKLDPAVQEKFAYKNAQKIIGID